MPTSTSFHCSISRALVAAGAVGEASGEQGKRGDRRPVSARLLQEEVEEKGTVHSHFAPGGRSAGPNMLTPDP